MLWRSGIHRVPAAPGWGNSTAVRVPGLRSLRRRFPPSFPRKLLLVLGERLGRLCRGGWRLSLDVGAFCLDGQPLRGLCPAGCAGRMVRESGSLPHPDLRALRLTRCDRLRTIRGHAHILNSGFPRFDLHTIQASRSRFRSASSRRQCAALSGGYSFPCLDFRPLPWGRFVRRGLSCRDLRGRLLLHGRVRRGMRIAI